MDERPTGGGSGSNTPDKRLWNAGGRTARRRTVTYADAGVSIHAGEQAVAMLKSKVKVLRSLDLLLEEYTPGERLGSPATTAQSGD